MNIFVLNEKKIEKERKIAIHHHFTYKLKTKEDIEHCKKISKEYKEYLFDYIKNHKKWWYKFWHKKRPKEIQIKKYEIGKQDVEKLKILIKQIDKKLNIYKNKVPYLNLLATHFCNLNCKGCGAFMPLYNLDKEKKYMRLEDLEKCLIRYNELFYDSSADIIDIVGGEPLLHPQISEFCEIVRKYNPKSKISVITNGILIDKMKDEFFETLIKNDIKLTLSIYGEGIYFEKFNIDLTESGDMDCSKCSGHLPIVNVDKMDVSFGGVQLIEDGTLYYCAFDCVKKINEFFGTEISFEAKLQKGYDYINIFEVESKEEILKMFQQEKCPMSRFCHKRDFFEWDISERDMYEWVKN